MIVYKVYIIHNFINNDKYVGMTSKTLNERFVIHKAKLTSKCSGGRTVMYDDMRNFGFDKFRIELVKEFSSKKEAMELEKQIQISDEVFFRYAKKDLNRCTSPTHSTPYKFISESEIMYFKTTVEAAKFFNCHKTNITKAITNGYRFMKTYDIIRISKDEYSEHFGQLSLGL